MDKIFLEKLINKGLSQRDISKQADCSHSTTKYWLKKHGLKTKNKPFNKRSTGKKNHCKICQKPSGRRWLCAGHYTKVRRYRTKKRAVDLLGGACVRCGWNENIVALQFHHKNDDKEFSIANGANKSWERVKDEVAKCELLCANCHNIEHSNQDEHGFMEALAEYQGR